MHRTVSLATPWLVAALACGGSSGSGATTPSTTPSGFLITLRNSTFVPAQLSVPPGATVTVVNDDAMPHSVTSEATTGSYAPGAVSGVSFDTGAFSSGQRTITITAQATAGTVIPFFCTEHRAAMVTPNGAITIDPNAKPSAALTAAPGDPAPSY